MEAPNQGDGDQFLLLDSKLYSKVEGVNSAIV